jgi:hypothetical protein
LIKEGQSPRTRARRQIPPPEEKPRDQLTLKTNIIDSFDSSTINDQDKGPQVRKEFTVKPGEILDLGDILIERPQH